MGYYTYFTLSVDGAKPNQFINIYKAFYKSIYGEEIDPLDKDLPYEKAGKIYTKAYGGKVEYEVTDVSDIINNRILDQDLKWYDYYEDVVDISEHFPEVIFHLAGDGEDRDDLWEADFMNGVSQQRTAIIPPFDKHEFLQHVYEINPPLSKATLDIQELI